MIMTCPFEGETKCKNARDAAKRGHLECLKYTHENDCEWDGWACKDAAYYGNLDCLKYAHENGCEWDEWTCAIAAQRGHLECLKYAHQTGCPYIKERCLRISHENCRQYIIDMM